ARNMDIDIDHDSTYDCIDILTASEPEPEKEEFEVWCHNIARTLNGFVNYGESIDRVVEGFRKMPKR
ncbi:MAG TPA: hypothetical protein DCL81_15735, partial [Algoriphagus sp.]|nr:hypothetical protein [Algoriphagus sp.]